MTKGQQYGRAPIVISKRATIIMKWAQYDDKNGELVQKLMKFSALEYRSAIS